jgi:hypothetical protein
LRGRLVGHRRGLGDADPVAKRLAQRTVDAVEALDGFLCELQLSLGVDLESEFPDMEGESLVLIE